MSHANGNHESIKFYCWVEFPYDISCLLQGHFFNAIGKTNFVITYCSDTWLSKYNIMILSWLFMFSMMILLSHVRMPQYFSTSKHKKRILATTTTYRNHDELALIF